MGRKYLILAMLIGTFFSVQSAWAVEWTLNGDFRVRGFYHNNVTDAYDDGAAVSCTATNCDDQTAYNSLRFLLTTKAKAGITTGVVTLDFTSASNTGNLRLGGGGQTGGDGDVPFGPADDRFALLEAYIRADFKPASVIIGRQGFKLGHSLIFEDTADALVVDIPLGSARLTVANLKIRDNTNSNVVAIGNSTASGNAADTDFYVGNLSLMPTPEMTTNVFLGYYANRGIDHAPTVTGFTFGSGAGNSLQVFVLGATVDAKVSNVFLSGELDFLKGSMDHATLNDPDVQGLNVQVSGNMDLGVANAGLTFLYASGQDPSDTQANGGDLNMNGINGNYATGIVLTNIGATSNAPKDGTCLSASGGGLGGVPNCIGGSGLMAIKAMGSMSPVDKLNLEVDAIYASAAEENIVGGSKDIGIELDAIARYSVDEHTSILGGVGYLITGDFFKPATTSPSTDNKMVLVLELSYRF